MFVWMKSDGRGTSVGCCGGIFFLPMALASLLLGLGGDSAWLLFIVFAAIGVLLLQHHGQAEAGAGALCFER